LTPAEFSIKYEDAHLAIVSKAAGLVTHPAPGTAGETLVEALAKVMTLAPAAPGEGNRPGIVHRLDRFTSGLLVVAKTDEAMSVLRAAMKARAIQRVYLALAAGSFEKPTGRIEAPVGRSPSNRALMTVTPEGRPAVTSFRVEEQLPGAVLLRVTLETGRTHQIRVHLSHISHPIVGDPLYGRRTAPLAAKLNLHRPFLHAAELHLTHPATGEEISITDPLPADLDGALEKARRLT
jgi:23S rRNA pseudouridine1911/1915/1917 synthase